MIGVDPELVVLVATMAFLFSFGLVQRELDAREAKRIEEEQARRRDFAG